MPYSRGECRLKSERLAKNLTQAELGRRSGYSRQMIYKFENNLKKMSPEAMYSMSRALDCSMEDLYEWIWVDSDAEK